MQPQVSAEAIIKAERSAHAEVPLLLPIHRNLPMFGVGGFSSMVGLRRLIVWSSSLVLLVVLESLGASAMALFSVAVLGSALMVSYSLRPPDPVVVEEVEVHDAG